MEMTREGLLAELDDLLRTKPSYGQLGEDTVESLSWLGRAAAVIKQWSPSGMISGQLHINQITNPTARNYDEGCKGLMVLLYQARAELRMETVGPSDVAIPGSRVFDYFDEIRKVIEEAQTDILFVDPYLEADFVSRYLPHVRPGVGIRLLAREKLNALVSAADLFAKQNGSTIQIRSASNFHDRYVFIDGRACYQSGASFKDGAKKSPTTITQILDAFPAVHETYEKMWSEAKEVAL